MQRMLIFLCLLSVTGTAEVLYERGRVIPLTPSSSTHAQRGSSSVKWYTTPSGAEIGVTSTLIVQWKNEAFAASELKKVGLPMGESMPGALMSIAIPSDKNVFEYVERLKGSTYVLFVQPATVRKGFAR